jgi:uncharacterized protein YcnI
VIPDNPTSGGFSALTFRVPNESETAGTTKVSVQLPQDTPFVYVSTKPVPGWTVKAVTAKLPAPYDFDGTTITEAVRTVTWTANRGTEIGPGEYQEFSISAGPMPEPATILLPATQTYSDGTVVAWDQATPASGEEPEHPAPELTVVAAAAGTDHHGGESSPQAGTTGSAGEDPPGETATAAASTVGGGTGVVLGGLGLAAGVIALVVSLIALRRGASAGSTP